MDGSTKQTQVYDIQAENQKIIHDYIEARKTETNLASSTQKVMIDNLNRFSRNIKKDFKDVTRDDIVSFLNSLRKSETGDPSHKWIGTYNLYSVTIGTFFKWFYYPEMEPKERPKPEVLLNLNRLKRKETSTYKQVLILEKNAELQTYISPYYDASRYVMEKSIKDKDDKQKESESISIV